MPLRSSLFIVVALLLSCANMLAQQWEPATAALWGGRPNEIHRDVNGNLWASTGTAVYRSSDQGASWVDRSPNTTVSFMESFGYRLTTLIAPGGIPLVIVYPVNGISSTIYASLTSGTSWQDVPMPEQFIGQPLYITGLSNGTGLAFVGSGSSTLVMVSSDAGATWTLESTLGSRPEQALESSNGTLYCIEPESGVLRMRSPDGQWGAVASPRQAAVRQFAVAQNHVLVVTSFDSTYITSDNGTTWSVPVSAPPTFTWSINNIAGLNDGSFIGSSRFESTNGFSQFRCLRLQAGSTEWEISADSLNHELDNPLALDGTSFIAIDDRGPVVSIDAGTTFAFRTTGLAMHFIWRHSISNTTVIACTINGDVFRINQDGGEWENVTHYPRSQGDFPVFDVVHAGNDVFLINTRSGVERSTDAGRTWQLVDGTSNLAYHEFVVGPDGSVYLPSAYQIFRSTDAGATWASVYTALDSTSFLSEVAVTASGRILYSAGRAIYAIDGGTATLLREVDVSIGLLRASTSNPQLLAYLRADEDEATRFISVSTDGGVNWRDVEYNATPNVEPPAFDAVLLPSGQYIVSSIDGLTTVYAPDAEAVSVEPTAGIEITTSLALEGQFYYRARNSYIEYRPYPTSVRETASENILQLFAHPQPARGTVTVTGTAQGAPLVVCDARGSVVTALVASEAQTAINVDGLTPGVYVVRSGNSSVTIAVY